LLRKAENEMTGLKQQAVAGPLERWVRPHCRSFTECYLPHLDTKEEAFESFNIPPSLCADMYKKLRFKSIV